MRLRIAALAMAVLALGCGDAAEERRQAEQEAATRAIMRDIFDGLRVALPASADLGRLEDPAHRAEITAALDRLARNAELLESHTRPKDPQMNHLARSVARDAQEVRRAFEEERYPRAAFLMREITENCVVCHTRLPSDVDSEVAEHFVDRGALAELPLEPRATLLTATRQFDAALATLEELLLLPGMHPAMLLGPITDYLVVSIRVKDDYVRPIATLKQFRKNPALWEELRQDVDTWIEVLPEVEKRAKGSSDLDTARELLDEGRRMTDDSGDRDSLVHFVAASGILQRFIQKQRKPSRELGEAYYLLGITEVRIGRNYWVTEAPFLLERAIRMAPQEDFAREAYQLLESEMLSPYEGSDEEELPVEDQMRLTELRRLIEGG